MEYFHLNYRSHDVLIGRIQTRVTSSTSAALRTRYARWGSELGDLALAAASKLRILRTVSERVDVDLLALSDCLRADPSGVAKCVRESRTFHVVPDKVMWETVTDVEGFIITARSLCEVLGKFVKKFFHIIFERDITETDIQSALECRGVQMQWAETLRAARIHWFHHDAPWLAVELLSDNRYDLLVLNRDPEHRDDPADYMRFDEWRKIYAGLQATIEHLYSWIDEEITKIENSG